MHPTIKVCTVLASAAVLLASAYPFRSVSPDPVLEPALDAADAMPQGPGRGMRMRGGGSVDDPFTEGKTCALCHSAAESARALWSPTGDDVSPHGTWKATMMANAFRDPYWRAQVTKELAAAPDDQKRAEIEALCLTCHGPMAHHTARLGGHASPGVLASADDALAMDGVSCTVCHQANGENFGKPESFSGQLDIRAERKIYGPYEDPAFRPMLMHTGYTATHGPHVRDAGLCGSCHTLFTNHVPEAGPFAEQTPYLEWLNSEFTDAGGPTGTSQTCQECHMPEVGEMRIARNPAGLDFNIGLRDGYRAHTFVGGNAFMLDILRRNADELGVTADADAFRRNARATRRQLAHATADLSVDGVEVGDGTLAFDVKIANRTGHKFPTGYPARRAWVHVQVRNGRDVVFESGAFDDAGRLLGVTDERGQPHHAVITEPGQVQVYEVVATDAAGAPTTYLTKMAGVQKDNRILPRGWLPDGPYAENTRPVGTGDDVDFAAGGDKIAFRVPVPKGVGSGLVIVAWLHYQSIPPAWVEPLRTVDSDEARRFVRMYDAADKTPETVGVTVAIVP